MLKENKILVCIDGSYWMYYCLFGAVSLWQKKNGDEASRWIKKPEETDQSNLPNLLNSDNFRKILKQIVMKRCETIDWILKQNFPDQLDIADKIDIIFAMDDRVSNSFRKTIYSEYKSQRAIVPKSYQIQPIKDYIINVIFKELEVEENHGFKLVKVEGAEGDDVIACTMRNYKEYILKVLFASDHDFLQLDEDVHQFDLMGKEVVRKVGDEILNPGQYLLHKIILGDVSDNIQQVFERVGPKKVLKLVKDPELLKSNLKENQEAASRFLLNKSIISFSNIPQELQDNIITKVDEYLKSNNNSSRNDLDLSDFMNL